MSGTHDFIPWVWASVLRLFESAGVDVNTYEGGRVVFICTFIASHSSVFWTLNALLLLAERWNLISQWKIQKGKSVDPALWRNCLKELIVAHLTQPISLFIVYPFAVYMGGTLAVDALPSWSQILWQFLVCLALNETLFYWSHRLLHHRLFYGRFHKKHHEFTVSTGIAAEYATPFEQLLSNTIPSVLPALLLGVHFFTLCLWMMFRIWETVDGHSGYKFPFSPSTWLCDSASRHDFHHSHNVGNFGTAFCLFDTLCGTDKAFLLFRAKSVKHHTDLLEILRKRMPWAPARPALSCANE